MNLEQFNQAEHPAALALLQQCCAAQRWAACVAAARPFANAEALLAGAGRCWGNLDEEDYLEAFAAHPKIGKFSSVHGQSAEAMELAAGEQRATADAAPVVIEKLARCNREYEEKFGFIFIICASGRSAAEMLAALRARLVNTRHTELANAAAEQSKITRKRLCALILEDTK